MNTQRRICYILVAAFVVAACLLLASQPVMAGSGAGGKCIPSAELCNGIDDNCDGRGDEGLYETQSCGSGVCTGFQGRTCITGGMAAAGAVWGPWGSCSTSGATQSCYTGHAGTNGVGVCHDGTLQCLTDGTPGACNGEVTPSTEVCDGLDNDCDGQVDEGMYPKPIQNKPCQQLVCQDEQGWQILPADEGAICNPSAGECDPIERCNGISTECPANEFAPASRVCRGANGLCDKAEFCTGMGANCPADQYLPTGAVCRASAGACDMVEVCNGHDTACPGDTSSNDGASCDDGNKCTSHDSCQDGRCTSGAPATCAPIDACHEAGTCDRASGECTTGAVKNCNDDNPCTIDSCDNILGCKNVAKTCAAADKCHLAGTCNPMDGECTAGAAISCAPADACHAAKSCNLASGLCEGGAERSCDDGDPCTTDSCTIAAGGCVNSRIEGCGGAEGCTPGNSRPCADVGTGGCDAKQICLPDRTWGECAFDESQVCEDLAVRDACAIAASGRCTEAGACVYTQAQNLCANDDACCPAGCNANNDNDCDAFCGNALVEAGEICEAAGPGRICSARCDDADVSTRDTMTGSASTCNVRCQFTPITECANNDSFCPTGCLSTNDNDCAGCGNGRVEVGEACDVLGCAEGSSCNSECACVAAAAVCGNGRIEAPEACDGAGCAEGSICNSECACVAETPDETVTFMTICEGASPKTKAANEEIRAAVPGLTGDRICDAEIARIIFILSFVPDPNLEPSNLNANTLPFALLQTGGHLVLKTDQNWKEREYRVLGSPTIIMAQRNIMESRSPASAPQLAGLLSSYAVPPDFKAIGDEQGIINQGGSLTYELRVTSAEPNFPLTLGSGEVLPIANPAASSADRKIVHTIITAVAPGTASVIAEGGPNVEEVKYVEDRRYNVANIIAAGGGRNAEWEPGDKLEFTLLQSKGSGNAIEMYPTVYAVRGDWGDGGDESGFGCALMTISNTDVPAAIFILLLIAILPAGALSLARAVVKNRWMKK